MPYAHWDPARELLSLQERMNRLIEQTLSRTRSDTGLTEMGTWSPAVDLFDSGEALVLKAELPEVEQEDIELRIEQDRVTLRGERRLSDEMNEKQFHRMERSFGRFSRSFDLPGNIDADNVTAAFKRGILKVTMPKLADKRSRQIPISS